MKKGEIYQGIIEKVDFPNKGRVCLEEGKVTVKNGIPGQTVRFVINKKKGRKVEGRLLEVLEKSPMETREPVCSIFPACGGCMYQTMPYEKQLKMKAEQVKELVDEAIVKGGQIDEEGRPDYLFQGIKGSPQEFAYRNKMEFSFGDEYKDGPLSLEYCREQGFTYYHKMQHAGFLRHLLLRRGNTTGEILVNLVTTSQEAPDLSDLIRRLLALSLDGKIVGILHIINDGLSDMVRSDETRLLYGKDYFYEEILGLKFKITPFSFFQPNSYAAQVLYNTAREYIGDTRDMTVFDLYSGTGTISQILAEVAKEVIGVEIVEEAVEAAKENAALNGITNCRFIAGDVLKVLDQVEEKPDFIVLDPPRDGIHPKALPKIIFLQAHQPGKRSGDVSGKWVQGGEGLLRGPVLSDGARGDGMFDIKSKRISAKKWRISGLFAR